MLKSRKSIRKIWDSAFDRCYDSTKVKYRDYGGRGIKMCDEWRDSFETFYQWAVNNGCEEGLQIDRIDNDGDYTPDNCRFVTCSKNQRNKRNNRLITAFGETKCVADWIDDPRCVVGFSTVQERIKEFGWLTEDALTLKPYEKNKSC
jgi:uncharacterized protein YhfF